VRSGGLGRIDGANWCKQLMGSSCEHALNTKDLQDAKALLAEPG
jgi:hypothetical protein